MPIVPPRFQGQKQAAVKDDFRLEIGSLVEYENQGVALLGVIIGDKKGKWALLNQRGREVELPSIRLYLLPGSVPSDVRDIEGRTRYLSQVADRVDEAARKLNLEEVWQLLAGEDREISSKEITELVFRQDSLENRLTTRRALFIDTVFFKRKKVGFEPRGAEVVEELKQKKIIEEKKQKEREALIQALVKRLNGQDVPLPPSILLIEQLAVFSTQAQQAREATSILETVLERSGKEIHGRAEEKAFQVLVAVGYFTEDENMALKRYQRPIEFSAKVLSEAEALAKGLAASILQMADATRIDLRSSYLITIDSETTRDVDDALSLERRPDGFRLGIHISDVASLIQEGSALEQEIFARGTSIYCPDILVPMVPPILSEELFSLHQGQERLAMSFFIDLNERGEVTKRNVTRSLVNVAKRYSYDEVDAILDGHEQGCSEEEKNLLFQLADISDSRERFRLSRGAIQFHRREMQPMIADDGKVMLEPSNEQSPGHKLIAEMMILANETAALFAKEHNCPFIYRTQEDPGVKLEGQGLDIPDEIAREYFQKSFLPRSSNTTEANPHFGLGLSLYAQATSPIRRAIDFLNQRQLLSLVTRSEPYYSHERLTELRASLEGTLDDAGRVQGEVNRYYLHKYLQQQRIRELDAIVIKVDTAKPLAEIEHIYALRPFYPAGFKQDRSIKTRRRPGDKIRLRIDTIDPRRDVLQLSDQES